MRTITGVMAILFIWSLVMIELALLTKKTGGLFWSRNIQQFLKDRDDPRYDLERATGKRFSEVVLKYVPAFALGFFLLTILTWFNIL